MIAFGPWMLLGVAAIGSAPGGEVGTAGPDLGRALLEYQRGQLAADQALRDAIKTPAALEAYKAKVRGRFVEVLGPWPERTALEPKVTGTLEREGYRVEKILIQSRPGFYVPINLYVPKNRPAPMPAVLSPLGHAPDGKAHATGDNYQARFITLVRKGYVVCAYDPLGQGEREAYGAETGNNHYVQGLQCMPSGRHLAQYFIWDGIRCLDYLETRPEVDRKRIACAGCSGGGALTNYIAAVDDRIAVAVPSSWIAESIHLTRDSGLHPESWFWGVCDPYGPGTRQLLACIAPRPLLILGNRDDKEFPPSSMEAVYRDTKKLYESVGAGDRVEYVSVPTPHGFWREARCELYRFLNQWFDKQGETADEPSAKPERKEDLWCARGGQVRHLPNAQTVWSLNRALMVELGRQRAERRASLSEDRYRAFVRQGVSRVAGYEPSSGPVVAQGPPEPLVGPGFPQRLLFEYEPGFQAMGDFYSVSNDDKTTGVVILIHEDNHKGGGLAGKLVRPGLRVFHVHTQKANPREEIMSGKCRCGRWAKLAIGGADLLKARGVGRVTAMGVGATGAMAAQFAAILEPEKFVAVVALNGLDSIESLSEGIAESHEMQTTIPGALRVFDLVDLAGAIAPRPQLIAGPVDKGGRTLSAERLRALFDWPIRAYARRGGADRLKLVPGLPSSEVLAEWIGSRGVGTDEGARADR
ncbi:MAG: acetylxylan esterase [Phycisphaerae bacterium]|nr:acetylxylan esterase [Phycisphaerae bacterium]